MKTVKSSRKITKLLTAIAQEKSGKLPRTPSDFDAELFPRYKSVFTHPIRRVIE